MTPVIPPGDAPGPPAEFACARCWKLKKKCDKVTPRCSRCTTREATCVYSFLPPKENEFTYRVEDSETRQFVPSIEDGNSHPPSLNTCQVYPIKSNPAIPIQTQLSHNGSKDAFMSQASTVLNDYSIDIKDICRRYFQTFHRWLSFISEEESWPYFFSSRSSTDPEFTALLLSIYLIASPPTRDSTEEESVEFIYSITKSSWSQLQATSKSSVFLIQAGLLLATYENGQALQEASRSSMNACVTMGHSMKLHLSVKKSIIFDSDSQAGLNTQRRLWWAIVILERLLSARDSESGCCFGSQHPTLDDYLPPSSDTTCNKMVDLPIVGVPIKADHEVSRIIFADVHPYPALGQATYLFDCVSKHIRNHTSRSESQEAAASLDRTLQDFARSLLRQAEGQSLNGNYCTSFFTSISSLVALHRHEISCRDSSEDNSADSLSRPFLAIRALTRIFQETAKERLRSSPTVPHIQPYDIYVVYLGATMHIELGDRSDEGQWQDELYQTMAFLQQLQKKWKIAEVYLQLIKGILG